MEALEIWERVEKSVGSTPTPAKPQESDGQESDDAADGRNWLRRLRWALLDVVATILWTYWLLKIFVVDIDRALVRRVAPDHLGVLDYRAFLYLGVLAVAMLLFRKWHLVGYVAYIAFFPFILVGWKIPRFFVRRRSWTLAMGAVNAVFVILGDFRYTFLTKTLAAVAAVLIWTVDSKPLLVASATYIASLLVWSFVRAVRKSFQTSLFIRKQSETIGQLVGSDRVRQLTAISDDLKHVGVQTYTQAQVQQFSTNLSMGLVLNRGLYFWAYQLDRYRRKSSAPIVLNAVTYLWLLLGSMIGFTLLNYALLKADPTEFSFEERPSLIAVAFYSLSSLALNDGGGFSATGDIAYLVRIFAGIYGPVALATFVLNVALVARRERDNAAIEETIAEVKERARAHEAVISQEYAVSVEEARRRLVELNIGLGWLVGYLTKGIPGEFFEPPDSSSHTPT